MKTAIIGLPMVGKTSLFTILTGVHEATRVGLMEARVGITKVPDARLDALAKIFEPPKITQATVEYLDFPSVSKEALRDPSYLASMRVADALAHVLRLFQSDTVPHEKGSVDPMRDFEDVEIELILSDFAVVEKRMERVDKDRKKTRNPELDAEFALPPDRIKEYQIQSRPFEEAVIAGIALRTRDGQAPPKEERSEARPEGDMDSDGDGLSDFQEVHKYGTDPRNRAGPAWLV